jgi:hypothetical protein
VLRVPECRVKVVIYAAMKVYVVSYWLRPQDEPGAPQKLWEELDILFSAKRGDWLLASREWAQRQLDRLVSFRVHAGEHYCQFELEEEAGTFAIVCKEHPEIRHPGTTGQLIRFPGSRVSPSKSQE